MDDAAGFTIEAPPRPVIQVKAGELPALATQGEAALRGSGLPIFQRGRGLVRPIRQDVPASDGRSTVTAALREITAPAMIDLLAQAAEWCVWNARKKEVVACDPPALVASVILSRAGFWTLPVVVGVTTTPTLRPDGSILSAPGYDHATRLYHVHDENLVLPHKAKPTRADAEQALALLDGLLDGFPFVSRTDRAVALSAMITPVVRGAMSVAPLHAFRATTPGSGKSYLGDLASIIKTGNPCPVIAAGNTEEETEKRLVGLILSGCPLISIDNVNGELGGDLLCQVIERPLVRVRPLGRSEIAELEIRATLFANGNGMRVRGDMTRRTLVCDLDANVERPELRSFAFDPLERVRADRGRYVAAALTVARAYLHAGRPGRLKPVASFAGWSDHVRSPLVWLGWPDPVTSMEAAREDDPELGELRELLTLWRDRFGVTESYTTRDIVDHATRRFLDDQGHPAELAMPEMLDALLRIAGDRGGINTKRLAKWLMAREGRIVGGCRLSRATSMAQGGLVRWCVLEAKG